MRVLAAGLVLAALAGCSVALEGAACKADDNCPSDQRCDTNASRCVACVPDATCTADGTACSADKSAVRTCRTNVAGCRYSVVNQDCGTAGLVCAGVAAPACACPANAGPVYADPAGSPSSAAVAPSGVASPTACRFERLGDALAAAALRGSAVTVKMSGWASSEVVFSSATTGEGFPIEVKPGVTLTTDDSVPMPAHYVVQVDQSVAGPAIQLDQQSSAVGFTVRPGAGGGATEGVLVSCAPADTGSVSVDSLVVDGKGSQAASAIGNGLRLTGPCGVTVTAVTAQNALGAGVRVESANGAAVSLASSTLRNNADSGLVVNLDASLAKPVLSMTGNVVTGNSATTQYTASSVTRSGGGVVLLAAAPGTGSTFAGNQVHGNAYDQILVYSSQSWDLRGGDCSANANVIACYDGAHGGVGLSSLGATVAAGSDFWENAVPSSGTDYIVAGGSVSAIPACGAVSTCP